MQAVFEKAIGRVEVLATVNADRAGRIALELSDVLRPYVFAGLHLLPHRLHWQWGYEEDWYDGPLYSFGLGPLALFVWSR